MAAAASDAAEPTGLAAIWHWTVEISAITEEWVLGFAESAWIYVAVFGVSFLDAIFPVVPSESVVIATSTTWAQKGVPLIWIIWIVAAAGAWCGDQVTYTVGTLINVRRIPGMNSRRGRASLDWAEHALENRGTSFIIAARFIPMGRIAVNLTAGALRYPRRRFMGVDAIAAVIWATWGTLLGAFAGSLFESNLIVAVVVGVVAGILLGYAVDKILSKIGLEPPDLPDIDELPERHITRKKRREERRRREGLDD